MLTGETGKVTPEHTYNLCATVYLEQIISRKVFSVVSILHAGLSPWVVSHLQCSRHPASNLTYMVTYSVYKIVSTIRQNTYNIIRQTFHLDAQMTTLFTPWSISQSMAKYRQRLQETS